MRYIRNTYMDPVTTVLLSFLVVLTLIAVCGIIRLLCTRSLYMSYSDILDISSKEKEANYLALLHNTSLMLEQQQVLTVNLKEDNTFLQEELWCMLLRECHAGPGIISTNGMSSYIDVFSYFVDKGRLKIIRTSGRVIDAEVIYG